MVKFLSAAFTAAVASVIASVAAQPGQGGQRPTPTPCVPLSFVEAANDIASVNTVINLAVSSGMLKPKLAAFDPLNIADRRLDAVPFAVAGADFTVTPIIQKLTVTGVSTVEPRPLNVSGPANLDIGVDFTGEVAMAGTLTFEIAQLNHKWWQICWTNILKPAQCPPALVTVDVGAGFHLPSVATNVNLAMVKCSPTAQGTCKDLTVTDIVMAGLSGKFDALLARILRRISSVSLDKFGFDFNKITSLNFHFHKSGPILTEVGKKLLAFTTKEINKKGDLYTAMIQTVNKLAKNLINKLIKEKLSPLVGNTCYDL